MCRRLGREPDLPKVSGQNILIEYLLRIGQGLQTGMGLVNLPYSEIDAWCRRVRINLTGWQSETLYLMSRAYVGQLLESKNRDCEPPYMAGIARRKKPVEDIGDGILKAFESLAGSKNKKSTRRPHTGKNPPRRGKAPTL
jgi:hypothetical protein